MKTDFLGALGLYLISLLEVGEVAKLVASVFGSIAFIYVIIKYHYEIKKLRREDKAAEKRDN